MNVKLEESIALMRRLYELQERIRAVKEFIKEEEQIKKRLKQLYPDGGYIKDAEFSLIIKKNTVTQYNIPDEIKKQYKIEGVRYDIEVKKLVD